MLTYIIDAFNLIYRVEKLVDSALPHASLLQFLKSNRLTGSYNNKVVVVFDGFDNSSVSNEREYEIIFSGPRTADDVIKDRVVKSNNRSQIVVVSDDKGLTTFVGAEGAKVKTVEEFVGHPSRLNVASDDEKEVGYEERRRLKEELEKIWVKEPLYNFAKRSKS